MGNSLLITTFKQGSRVSGRLKIIKNMIKHTFSKLFSSVRPSGVRRGGLLPPPETPGTVEDGQQRLQEQPRPPTEALRQPKTTHRGPKSGPRPPTEAPRAAQDHPQRPVNFTSNHPKMHKTKYRDNTCCSSTSRPNINRILGKKKA